MTGLVLLLFIALLLLAVCALAATATMSAATGLAIATGNLANQLIIGLLALALVVLMPATALVAYRHGRLTTRLSLGVRGARERDEREQDEHAPDAKRSALEQSVALPEESVVRQLPQPRAEHTPRIARRRVTHSAAARHGARLARRWFS